MPVGGTELRHTNVRLLTASHHDLAARVKEGGFREDLYYRLSVVPITLPPLRERRSEVIPLLQHYLRHFCQRHALVRRLDPEVLELLGGHAWPGNIRELINLVERLVVTTSGEVITSDVLPAEYLAAHASSGWEDSMIPDVMTAPGDGTPERTLKEHTEALERRLIEQALEKHRTTRAAAASLGINQSTLVKKMQKFTHTP